MLQATNKNLFNPLVPKAIASVKICYFFYKLSQEKSVQATLRILFFHPRH